jgi:protoporphyrinogen oxidase
MSKPSGGQERWAVLGGGMLGLTLALELAQRGKRVSLLEAAPAIGGLTSSWRHGPLSWDRFYHVIEASDRALIDLLRELGLDAELTWGVTKTNFFDGRSLYPLNDVFDYLRLPALGMLDKARLAVNILYGAQIKNGVALESERAEDWLVRWSGRRTFEKLWRPLMRSKLGDNFDKASAAYIWSVIHRFYGARQGRRKTELFGYVPGGYARIIEVLLERLDTLGVAVETGVPVQGVAQSGRGVEIVAGGQRRHFDRVIATFASPIAVSLCQGLDAGERSKHEGILYQGVVCASLLLKKPLGGAYLTYITDDTIPFTTVIEMSSLIDRDKLGGYHLAYLPKYLPSDAPMLEADDAAIESEFVEGLTRMFPRVRAADVEVSAIARARHVLAISTLNYSEKLPPLATAVPNLYICNSARIVNASLSVNETIELAVRTVTQLLD